jgi:hypothetical protein
LVIKPLEEDHTPATVKPFQVSLVEPVACSLSQGARRDSRRHEEAADPLTKGEPYSAGNVSRSSHGKRIAFDAQRNPDLGSSAT